MLCSHCMENIQNFGTKVQSRLFVSTFWIRNWNKIYCSHILESKQDFCSNILNAKEDFVKTWWLWSKTCANILDAKLYFCSDILGAWCKHLRSENLALFKHFEREKKLVLMRSHTFVQTPSRYLWNLSFFFWYVRIRRGFPPEITADNGIGMYIPANTVHAPPHYKAGKCICEDRTISKKKIWSQNVGTKVLLSIQTVFQQKGLASHP